ncbi:hypothetical protein ACW5F0_02805 [Luteimonas sp. A534]
MKIIPLVLVGLISAHSSALAQTRCSTDAYGNTKCRNSDGTATRASSNAFGNTTYRNSVGTTRRCSTDA